MPEAQPPVSPPPKADSLVVVLALATFIQALATFAVFALPTLAPKAAAAFGMAPQMVGYQVSVTYLAAALLSGFAGLFVRRFGATTTSLAALALAATGLLCLAAGNLTLIVLGSLCIGIGYGVTNPAGTQLLLRHEQPGRRNLIFAIKQAGVPFGAIIASAMLPRLAERVGWQQAIGLSVSLYAVLAVPLLMRRRRWDADRDPSTRLRTGALGGVALIVHSPLLRAMSITGFCYAAFQVCLIAFAVTMLATEFGWTLVEAGSIAAVMQAAGIAGRITWSLVADRLGNGLKLLLVIGVLSAALAIITSTMTAAWPAWAMILVLAAFGACIIGWNGIYMAETARVSGPQNAGLATGGVLIFNFVGVIVGPALFGIVSRATGSIATTFGIFAVLPLLGAWALVSVLKRGRD
jgi:predicted MFS family arabinose efflux permease